ncbi:MAG: sulfurtransferase complex subunit TusB [Thiothrix sp.]|nr:sulfurtransferase complex subunit TusB [Thiothrix sp.]HPQ95553.1 sulfurtransferase complex subunit TusB [Thiolinea sp.]
MSMLHIVNKSPFERNALESCLGYALAGDSILLIEDAVVGVVAGNRFAGLLTAALADRHICVLREDLVARGIPDERVLEGIRLVDYAGFVELTVENDRTQSWL